MKKVAIVGSNSYIARNLYKMLCLEYNNISIDLYDCANEHCDGGDRYKQIDILNEESVSEIDFNVDIVFMFVGKTGSVNGFDDYKTFVNINEIALLNLLNEHRKQGSKAKVIFPSTRLVYKGRDELLTEESEKEFKTVYAINKYACEQYLKQYANNFGIEYCILRICVPYGTMISGASSYGTAEFMLKSAMNNGCITLYGNGEVRRSLIYMKDLCYIIIEAAFSEECKNDIYNIGGENYSLREMAQMIAIKYKANVEYVAYPELAAKIESGSTVFDDSKLQRIIPCLFDGRFENWIENN